MGVGLEDLTQAQLLMKRTSFTCDDGRYIQFLSKGRYLTYYKEDARFAENVYGEWWDSGDYGMLDERVLILERSPSRSN